MVIAELFGPVGAGKSTLYRALASPKYRRAGWVGSEEKKIELVWKEKYMQSRLAGLFYWAASLHPRSRNRVTKGMRPSSLWSVMEGSRERWEPLVQYVLYNLEESRAPLMDSVRRYEWFFDSLLDRIYFEAQCENNSRILLDEGLIQRGIAFSLMQNEPKKTLSRYLNYMPIPDVAIHVTAPCDTLKERVSSRDGKNARLLKYADEVHELAVYAASKLQQSGVRVVKVNSIGSTSESVTACFRSLPKG